MASKRRVVRKKPAARKPAPRKASPRRVDPVRAYARSVTTGKVKAGRLVKLACERHLRDMRERKKTGMVWDMGKAEKALGFFRTMLVLEDGSPFDLLPFQEFIVGSVFGWFGQDGTRRFRTAYIETGKGSGKTPLAAGVGLYGLILDDESAPEVYAAAVTREQAKIVFKDAYRMVEAETELNDLVERQVGSLTIPARSGVFRPVSSEHRGLDGLRVHIGLIDELHEHPTATVVDKIRAGTKRRRNALLFEITNSGWDRTSVCWNHHEYSTRVLEGTADNESWFAYVCTLDEGDDWRDERVWIKANPGMKAGLPPLKYLREQVGEAVGMPSKENIVRRLNMCEWTEQEERWLEMAQWDACTGPIEESELDSCIAGLDMASTQDLTAFVMAFGPDDDGFVSVLPRFWVPEETLAASQTRRSDQDRMLLRQWVDQGFITATPGNVVDYDMIEGAVLEDAERFGMRELAFDRWNVTQLVTHLKDHLGDKRVIEFPQTLAAMTAPSKELEKLVADGKLLHGGNPVLRWMASNVSLRYGPDGQIKPDRMRSREKIDGVVGLVMALGRLMCESQVPDVPFAERIARGEEPIQCV